VSKSTRRNVFSAGNFAEGYPALVPMFVHGDKRHGRFRASSAACLPLYQVIARQDGRTRYENAKELAKGFGIGRGC
jgi:hypothetical protein